MAHSTLLVITKTQQAYIAAQTSLTESGVRIHQADTFMDTDGTFHSHFAVSNLSAKAIVKLLALRGILAAEETVSHEIILEGATQSHEECMA